MSLEQDFPRGYDDMAYSRERLKPAHILYLGIYKNYNFLIVNLGTHPTAYVRVPKTHPFYLKTYDDCNPSNSNSFDQVFTFSDSSANFAEYLDQPIPDGWYLGVDYAHLGDWTGLLSDEENIRREHRKYTTEEIILDCERIIEYLINYEVSVQSKTKLQI